MYLYTYMSMYMYSYMYMYIIVSYMWCSFLDFGGRVRISA